MYLLYHAVKNKQFVFLQVKIMLPQFPQHGQGLQQVHINQMVLQQLIIIPQLPRNHSMELQKLQMNQIINQKLKVIIPQFPPHLTLELTEVHINKRVMMMTLSKVFLMTNSPKIDNMIMNLILTNQRTKSMTQLWQRERPCLSRIELMWIGKIIKNGTAKHQETC